MPQNFWFIMLLAPSVIDCYHRPSFDKKETFVTIFHNERILFCHYLSHKKEITTPLYCHPVAIRVRFFVSRPQWGSRELPTRQMRSSPPSSSSRPMVTEQRNESSASTSLNIRDWRKKIDLRNYRSPRWPTGIQRHITQP